MHQAYIQYWEESKVRWGVRPDSATIHKTLEDCQAYIRNYWTVELKRNKGKDTPNEYSRPSGTPSIIHLPPKIYAKITGNGTRLGQDELRDYEVENISILKKKV